MLGCEELLGCGWLLGGRLDGEWCRCAVGDVATEMGDVCLLLGEDFTVVGCLLGVGCVESADVAQLVDETVALVDVDGCGVVFRPNSVGMSGMI